MAPILAPIVAVCLCLANCGFGCTPAPDPQHDTRAGLERQQAEHCKMTAKIQCPLQCDEIDFDAVCNANLGTACNAQCDTSATGTCLDHCKADCALGCTANANTACDATCHSMCGDNCLKICVGAPFPTGCATACKNECHSLCGDTCNSDSNSSCDGKCGASCNATCSVEAHVACELRCSVDAWTTCKATVRANCMADCSTDVMLSCGDPSLDPQPEGSAVHGAASDRSGADPPIDGAPGSSIKARDPGPPPVRSAGEVEPADYVTEKPAEGVIEAPLSVVDAGSQTSSPSSPDASDSKSDSPPR